VTPLGIGRSLKLVVYLHLLIDQASAEHGIASLMDTAASCLSRTEVPISPPYQVRSLLSFLKAVELTGIGTRRSMAFSQGYAALDSDAVKSLNIYRTRPGWPASLSMRWSLLKRL